MWTPTWSSRVRPFNWSFSWICQSQPQSRACWEVWQWISILQHFTQNFGWTKIWTDSKCILVLVVNFKHPRIGCGDPIASCSKRQLGLRLWTVWVFFLKSFTQVNLEWLLLSTTSTRFTTALVLGSASGAMDLAVARKSSSPSHAMLHMSKKWRNMKLASTIIFVVPQLLYGIWSNNNGHLLEAVTSGKVAKDAAPNEDPFGTSTREGATWSSWARGCWCCHWGIAKVAKVHGSRTLSLALV